MQKFCCRVDHVPVLVGNECTAGVTALSLLITPFLMQASNRWLLLADPEAGTLVSLWALLL